MTGICSYCGRIYLTTDPGTTVCRTMHENTSGGRSTCTQSFCSDYCYERHLMETEGR